MNPVSSESVVMSRTRSPRWRDALTMLAAAMTMSSNRSLSAPELARRFELPRSTVFRRSPGPPRSLNAL